VALDVAALWALRDWEGRARVGASDRDGRAVAFGCHEQVAVLDAGRGKGAG
jgi:hypothetical protein